MTRLLYDEYHLDIGGWVHAVRDWLDDNDPDWSWDFVPYKDTTWGTGYQQYLVFHNLEMPCYFG